MLGLRRERGVGVLEVVISTAVAALLITSLFTFVVRSFTPPRQQYEQGRITEDARIQLNRMSDLVRSGANVDFSGNGKIDAELPYERWLQYGDQNEIIFYTRRDIAGNNRLERIRLWLDGSDLKMEVGAITAGACFTIETTQTVARSVRNVAEATPLFTYYVGAITVAAPVSPANVLRVNRVEISLAIDTDLQQAPAAAFIRTEVMPRQSLEAAVLVGSPPQCSDCLDNDLDGRIDTGDVLQVAADPGCENPSDSSEKGTLECDNGLNDDADEGTDYLIFGGGDPQCVSPSGASEGGKPECEDGVDNDNDGTIDRPAIDWPDDVSCSFCTDGPNGPKCNAEGGYKTQCQNGEDDDGNGFEDYPDDFGCESSQDDDESELIGECNNGLEDDGDGLIDFKTDGTGDPDCLKPSQTYEQAGKWACNDGEDNDSDIFFDFKADGTGDFSCSSAEDDNEHFPRAQCQDGKDNDGDGSRDMTSFNGAPPDFSCASSQDNDETNPKAQCQDGEDNDGDTLYDLNDPDCASKQDNNESHVAPAKIFVTANEFPANFGGLGAADAICQAQASAGGLELPNQYKALLSDSTTDAKNRFNIVWPLSRPDGTIVAVSAAQLWNGVAINAPINITASGQPATGPNALVWTGTDPTGVKDAGASVPSWLGWGNLYPPFCANWTSTSLGVEGGNVTANDSRWVSISGYAPYSFIMRCNFMGRLYCIGPSYDCVPGEISGTPQCSDGKDNDCDGLKDGGDPACSSSAEHNNEWSTSHQCNDGFDNDSNGLQDFQGAGSDPKCVSNGDKSEFQAKQQ